MENRDIKKPRQSIIIEKRQSRTYGIISPSSTKYDTGSRSTKKLEKNLCGSGSERLRSTTNLEKTCKRNKETLGDL